MPVSLESAPLTPALVIGDRTFTSLRLRCSAPGSGWIEFGTRPVAIDAFGNSARSGPPRLASAAVELVEVKDAVRPKTVNPEPKPSESKPGEAVGAAPAVPTDASAPSLEQGWRLFTIRPASSQDPNASGVGRLDWSSVVELRLAVAPGECAPRRLLVLEKAGPNMDRIGSVRRVITLEPLAP